LKAIVFTSINEFPSLQDINLNSNSLVNVDITYAALNHRDIWITKGLYPGLMPNRIMGSDGVGYLNGKRVIIYPGKEWGNIEDYQSLDFRALGVPDHGTFAEHIFADSNHIYDIPDYLLDEEAACLPVAGLTAYRALFTKCKIKSGDKILLTGIGGGVALLAAQMAHAIGAEVYFTSGSYDKISRAIQLGFAGGVNYKNPEYIKELQVMTGGIDVIVDGTAGDGLSALLKLCNYGARIACYGGTLGKINGWHPQLMFWKQISFYGTTMGSPKEFSDMLHFFDTHKIRPIIDTIFPLEDYKFAFNRMEEGKQFGKIVLKIS
jgi:zinc-binding alcohol dehydrogenase/oxidoreductase